MTTMRRTLYNETGDPVIALTYEAIDADATTPGEAIDLTAGLNNYRDSVLFIIHTGAVTDGTFVFSLEESDTVDDDYVAVPAARVQGAVSLGSGDDVVVKSLGYIPGGYRYVRLSVDSADTDSGGIMGAFAVASGAAVTPVPRA